jgi:DNA-binding LytR/AlgR family response regulator
LLNRFGKLENIAPELPPEFVRIHQSYVVNISRAASMKNYRLYMDNGTVLPVSRPYRGETSRAFFASVAQEI